VTVLRLVVNLRQGTPCTDALVQELRDLGMVVGRVSTLMGVVSGQAPAPVVEAIRARPDVAEVADESRLWDRHLFR
jgi:hypothetical protein